VLYNGVDTVRFAPGPPRRQDGPLTLLVTGKIDSHLFYRLDSTLRALALAVARGLDARLAVAGWVAPEAAAKARALASELGLAQKLKLTGAYTQEQAPAIYGAADIYVMTKHNDPCPNTVLEALACGLPVVYSASGGVPELVGDAGIGVPVPEDWSQPRVPDAEALAQAIVDVAAQRAAMGALARRRAVERFDIAHWLARHRQVFESLV
jgi:glycosyltransferase involved in cell wall biosynthesis